MIATVVRLKVDLGVPKTPPGLYYKGGAARAALMKAVRGWNVPIRDLDFIFFPEEIDGEEADEAASRIAVSLGKPLDIEAADEDVTVESWVDHTDLNVNACLYDGEELVCDESAIEAAKTLEIRPVEYNPNYACPYRSRVLMRCVRIAADLGGVCALDEDEMAECFSLHRHLRPFDVWLQGERAREAGKQDEYFRRLVNLRIAVEDSFERNQEYLSDRYGPFF